MLSKSQPGIRTLTLGLVVLMLLAFRSEPQAQASGAPPYAPNRVLVRFTPDLPASGISGALARIKARATGHLAGIDVYVVEIEEGGVAKAITQLRHVPGVIYAEPDYLAFGAMTPNDADYGTQYAPQMIQAEEAWDVTLGDANVVVAILDTGVDLEHPEFDGRLLPGYDFINSDDDPRDDHSHGTLTTGIAVAATNNETGIAGIAGDSSILPIKTLDENNQTTYSVIADSIIYAADHDADVINLSLGGYTDSQTLRDAVEYAWERGAVLVAAAGNDDTTSPFYPAAYEHVLAVSATTKYDDFWSGSNYGDWIDISAPGYLVYSTSWSASSGSTYGYLHGTSASSPHAAGVAALLRAQEPDLSSTQIRAILEQTANDKGDPGWDPYYGHGRLNAGNSLTTASIGDRVWWDIDGDGVQDAGEPGLADVEVILDSPSFATATDALGNYGLANLGAGEYSLSIPSAEFDPGGTLENWYGSPQHAAGNEVDSDADPATHIAEVTIADSDRIITNVDFGFDVASDYGIRKTLITGSPILPGDQVRFEVTITNTGDTWLTHLALQDSYDVTYLSFVDASIAPNDPTDDGVLDWENVVSNLAAGESITVTLDFEAKASTVEQGLTNDETQNQVFADAVQAAPTQFLETEFSENLSSQRAEAGVLISKSSIDDLTIQLQTEAVQLTWDDIGGEAYHYEVYGNTHPYFELTDVSTDTLDDNVLPLVSMNSVSYIDSTHSSGDVYYYRVAAVEDEEDQVLVVSNHVGLFSFNLVPGD